MAWINLMPHSITLGINDTISLSSSFAIRAHNSRTAFIHKSVDPGSWTISPIEPVHVHHVFKKF